MNKQHLRNNGPANCAIISFQPHNVCNFTCDYCHSSSNGGDLRWNKNYTNAAEFVNNIRDRNGYVYLEILGGEPTLWPQLTNFIDKILHKNLVVELNSNGSRSLRYWEEFPAGQNVINFSWHSKDVDTNYLYEVVKIMKLKSYVIVTFLLTPENFNKGLEAIEKFKDLHVELNAKPTRKCIIRSELYDFTESQLNYIKSFTQDWSKINTPSWRKLLYPSDIITNGQIKQWHSITINKENVFTGWKCSAGINRFTIDPTGDIKKCYPGVDGLIGNVYTGYILPTEPTICTYQHACHCKLDAMVEKRSPDV